MPNLSDSLSNFKSYNIKRQHDQKHDEKQLAIGERKAKLQLLKTSLTSSTKYIPETSSTIKYNCSCEFLMLLAKE